MVDWSQVKQIRALLEKEAMIVKTWWLEELTFEALYHSPTESQGQLLHRFQRLPKHRHDTYGQDAQAPSSLLNDAEWQSQKGFEPLRQDHVRVRGVC